MKLLQNKLTREIGCLVCSFGKTPEKITVVECIDGKRGSKVWYYNSLAELNEEWCDYEEPEVGYIIDPMEVDCVSEDDSGYEESDVERAKELGIWFGTKEEAEKAVERLRAWKRLKDKGFRFDGYDVANRAGDNVICGQVYFKAGNYDREEIEDDLHLLFLGGEE